MSNNEKEKKDSLSDYNLNFSELIKTIQSFRTQNELRLFLEDLCTPSELRSMADRWKVAKMLFEQIPYRSIYDQTGVSTATITRVARSISYGSGGYLKAMKKKKGPQ